MSKKLTKSPWFYTVVGFIFLVICWIVFYLIIGNSFILPSPISVIEEGLKLLGKVYFYKAFLSTLLGIFIAFIIALILSIISVWLSKINWVFNGIFSALTSVLRSIPTLAIILLIIVYASRSVAPVVVCVLTLYPMFTTAIFAALLSVDEDVLEMCKLYGVSKEKYYFKVLLPNAAPILVSELLSGLGFALKLVISAEILVNCYNCLGGLMNEASIYDKTAMLFAETTMVVILGGIIEVAGKTLLKRRVK